MVNPQLLMEALTGFAKTLAGGYQIADVLYDLADRVTPVLGIAGAGVSILDDDGVHYATTNNDLLAGLERSQEQHQQGPCVDSMISGEVVAIPDLAEYEHRWPDYVRLARSIGVVATVTLPMIAGSRKVGALDLFDYRHRSWTEEDLTAAGVLADMATAYVINASELDRQRRTTEQLERALASRVVIEQAKGIIAASNNITVDEAFKVLRKHANDHNANLHQVAEAVVNLGLRP